MYQHHLETTWGIRLFHCSTFIPWLIKVYSDWRFDEGVKGGAWLLLPSLEQTIHYIVQNFSSYYLSLRSFDRFSFVNWYQIDERVLALHGNNKSYRLTDGGKKCENIFHLSVKSDGMWRKLKNLSVKYCQKRA